MVSREQVLLVVLVLGKGPARISAPASAANSGAGGGDGAGDGGGAGGPDAGGIPVPAPANN